MGHQRIGRLPHTRQWRAVLGLLAERPETSAVAVATMQAAQVRLAQLKDELALPYCYWLLVRLTVAAREGDFVGDAARVGVTIKSDDTAISFIARLSREVADTLRRHPGAS